MQTAPGGILALDTGTRTGWCYGTDPRVLPSWGVIVLDGIDCLPASYVGLDNELTDLVQLLRPRRVVFEAPLTYTASGRDPRVPLLLLGLAAHVQSACFRGQVPCEPRNLSHVRKAVLGRGGFAKPWQGEGRMRKPRDGGAAALRGDPKEEVGIWARNIGWQAITDHNARDAAVLLRYELMYSEARTMAGAGSALV